MKKGLNIFLGILTLITLGGYVFFNPFHKGERPIFININDRFANHFIAEADIKDIISDLKEERSITNHADLDLKAIEQELKSHHFVKEAQVSRNLKGDLIIDVLQARPLARLIANNGRTGYLSTAYEILPLSDGYTARVMVITGSGVDSMLTPTFYQGEEGQHVKELLQFISGSKFWNAQIGHLEVSPKIEFSMYPQIGNHKIIFGRAERIAQKFKKVEAFYNEVIPFKGWDKYDYINVKYKDQIVCK